ncbi:DUF3261 domain-containing protein [Solimonas flava]|uniref:DUF3261 domain-containing protein n=1 Tax=Solimonas flava TaxID=415849 RepID=UPI00040E9579|nr:DUF3261 domain-containing protein [Solimonas flava]
MRRLLACAAALLLGGCANGPVRSETPRAAAPPLLAPASVGDALQVQQLLHAAYGSDETTLQCVVSDDLATLSVVCLTALGQRVFTLDWDGRQLKAQRAPLAPERIDPQRIVADLQLAFWPLAALQDGWRSSGYAVSEPRPGLRRVLRDGRIVAEVHRGQPPLAGGVWPARLWLVNLAYGYTLDIETQDAAE